MPLRVTRVRTPLNNPLYHWTKIKQLIFCLGPVNPTEHLLDVKEPAETRLRSLLS
jgi:hypothetical protein